MGTTVPPMPRAPAHPAIKATTIPEDQTALGSDEDIPPFHASSHDGLLREPTPSER